MAEWWKNLNLFKPGTDDNMGVEESLNGNFQKIDEKLGDALTDKNLKKHATLGARLNEEQGQSELALQNSELAMAREYNVVKDDLQHHTISLRGFAKGAPENTYAAFTLAKQMGYWGIKTEIQLTSDNRWIVFTDDTVDRVSNGTGTVASKTLVQMQALDVGTKLGGAINAGERILTLNQFLWFCREHNMAAYLEIKPSLGAIHATELLRLLSEYSMIKRTALLSTNIPALQLLRDLNKNVQLGYVTSVLDQTQIDYIKPISNSFMYVLWTQILPDKYKLAIDNGMLVDAWNPSDYEDVQTAVRNGARRVVSSTVPF